MILHEMVKKNQFNNTMRVGMCKVFCALTIPCTEEAGSSGPSMHQNMCVSSQCAPEFWAETDGQQWAS